MLDSRKCRFFLQPGPKDYRPQEGQGGYQATVPGKRQAGREGIRMSSRAPQHASTGHALPGFPRGRRRERGRVTPFRRVQACPASGLPLIFPATVQACRDRGAVDILYSHCRTHHVSITERLQAKRGRAALHASSRLRSCLAEWPGQEARPLDPDRAPRECSTAGSVDFFYSQDLRITGRKKGKAAIRRLFPVSARQAEREYGCHRGRRSTPPQAMPCLVFRVGEGENAGA